MSRCRVSHRVIFPGRGRVVRVTEIRRVPLAPSTFRLPWEGETATTVPIWSSEHLALFAAADN
ncbi:MULTISPECIES: hypothetical protein [Bradyrhizobium]|uniref:hypothetical protein n=1 Tax=Bradyrhizobium TaxID=374 RepID=UPI001EDAE27F|nr:hypothetical protein [Bradyrhizobium zhengyangense]MCG2639422.1 hypothetical protein [Bradyrhizobium zhengyangense]